MNQFVKPDWLPSVLSGMRVLVTGASSGIGRAVALGLAEAGARLSVLAENDLIHDAAAEIAHEAHRSGRTVREVARDSGLLDDETLARALDPRAVTGE